MDQKLGAVELGPSSTRHTCHSWGCHLSLVRSKYRKRWNDQALSNAIHGKRRSVKLPLYLRGHQSTMFIWMVLPYYLISLRTYGKEGGIA